MHCVMCGICYALWDVRLTVMHCGMCGICYALRNVRHLSCRIRGEISNLMFISGWLRFVHCTIMSTKYDYFVDSSDAQPGNLLLTLQDFILLQYSFDCTELI